MSWRGSSKISNYEKLEIFEKSRRDPDNLNSVIRTSLSYFCLIIIFIKVITIKNTSHIYVIKGKSHRLIDSFPRIVK